MTLCDFVRKRDGAKCKSEAVEDGRCKAHDREYLDAQAAAGARSRYRYVVLTLARVALLEATLAWADGGDDEMLLASVEKYRAAHATVKNAKRKKP